MAAPQLEVTPWSEAGRGHLAFPPTGASWNKAGSAEALGELREAVPKRAAPLDQPAALPQQLNFEEEVFVEDPAMVGGGGGTPSDSAVLVAGRFMPV